MTIIMSLIKYFSDKKRIAKGVVVGLGLWGLSMFSPYAINTANAEGFFSNNQYGKSFGIKINITNDWLGGGRIPKKHSRNKVLENQVVGLTKVPALSAESSFSNYVVHKGDWAKTKEFGEGLVSFGTPYYNRNDGTKKWLPAWLSIGPGSFLGIPLGIGASTINGVTRGINYVFNTKIGKLYSSYEENFPKQAGTTLAALMGGGGYWYDDKKRKDEHEKEDKEEAARLANQSTTTLDEDSGDL